MCRWISYQGNPIPLEVLLVEPEYSLITQSMASRLGPNPTNGDGFGVGWFGRNNDPGVYRSIFPAWSDTNLNQLAHHIESPLFIAHIRRSTGTAVQQTNCHPFQHNNWIFVHNGLIRGFQKIRRDLVVAIDPKYFPEIRGNTDSELIFFLALTFGLEKEPIAAVEKAIGFIESLAYAQGEEHPIQMTLGFSDGQYLYAIRYSSEGDSRTLFHSDDISALRKLYPSGTRVDLFEEKARAVVSEPLSELPGIWKPIPESTALTMLDGEIQMQGFSPRAP